MKYILHFFYIQNLVIKKIIFGKIHLGVPEKLETAFFQCS